MPLVSQNLPNLLGGISQQPAVVRNDTQCEAQDNALPSPTLGLTQKPPLEQVKVLATSSIADNQLVHWINRDATERYAVTLSGSNIAVYDLAGNEKTVAKPDGVGYITETGDPDDNFVAVTVADYTFIVNKKKTVAMAAAPGYRSDNNYNQYVVIHIKQAVNGVWYTLNFNGKYYPVLSGSADTITLASAIVTAVNADLPVSPPALIGRSGSTLYLFNNPLTGSIPSVMFNDGGGGTYSTVIKQQIGNFSDLPPWNLSLKRIQVIGTDGDDAGSYYVSFEALADELVYQESYKEEDSGAIRAFDASTMPHILVRESDGTFTFKKATWDQRLVGDYTSVPNPSFVGSKIKDIFFYRNRLGLASDDNIILSRAGDYFNFWPETARETRDSDPIDTSLSHNKSTLINHAVPFDRSLMLLSDQAQFNLTADGALTNETARIDVATDYECSTLCKPVGAGSNMYFTSERGNYAALWEYFVTDQGTSTSASDVTSHVSKLIPAGTRVISAAINDDMVVVLTDGAKNVLYVYKMAWNGNTKVLSSWGTWTLPSTAAIQGVTVINSVMYMVVKYSSTDLSLLKAKLSPDTTAIAECGYVPHLDRQVIQATGTYDAGNDWTTWTLPYNHGSAKSYVVLTDDWGAAKKGSVLLATLPSTTTLRVAGDYSSGRVYLGLASTFTYTFSPFNLRITDGDGTTSVVDGRLQIRKLYIACGETGYLKVTVTPAGRTARTYEYGSPINVLKVETPLIEEMVVKVPARGKAQTLDVTVTSDSPLPLVLLNATWHGEFNKKGKPL